MNSVQHGLSSSGCVCAIHACMHACIERYLPVVCVASVLSSVVCGGHSSVTGRLLPATAVNARKATAAALYARTHTHTHTHTHAYCCACTCTGNT